MTICEPFHTNPIGIARGGAVLPDEGQPGQVTGQEFLAERLVEYLVESALIHDRSPSRMDGVIGGGHHRDGAVRGASTQPTAT